MLANGEKQIAHALYYCVTTNGSASSQKILIRRKIPAIKKAILFYIDGLLLTIPARKANYIENDRTATYLHIGRRHAYMSPNFVMKKGDSLRARHKPFRQPDNELARSQPMMLTRPDLMSWLTLDSNFFSGQAIWTSLNLLSIGSLMIA